LRGHPGPEFLVVLQIAIMLGPDKTVQVGRAEWRLVVHFVKVAFAVGDHDHLSLAHHPRRLRA
jgi:hypothetical protein